MVFKREAFKTLSTATESIDTPNQTRPWSPQRWLSLDHLSQDPQKNTIPGQPWMFWVRYGYNEALETKKTNN